MPTFQTRDGAHIPYEDIGSGSTFLFIPGWTMSRLSFHKQLHTLAESWRVITPDLRGQGESEQTGEEHIDLNTWVHDLHDFILQLHLTKVILVGWSLGALTMWTYVKQYGQERVAGLVHIDMVAQLPKGWAEYKNRLIDENYRHYMAGFIREMFMPAVNSEDRESFLNGAMHTSPACAKRLNIIMEKLDLSDTMRRSHLPVLFAFGKHSRFFTHAQQEETARLVPHATTVWFANSCHCPFWEEPELFNSALIDFAHRIGL
jgi:non-heme chloroperoxidase